MPRLADFYNEAAYPPHRLLEDIADQDVTVLGARFQEGTWGDYAIVGVRLQDKSVVSVVTGASIVMEALHNAISANALPLPAIFTKQGRRWVIE